MLPVEDILEEKYPKKAKLEDGTPITIRPMSPKDEKALVTFFNQIPKNDIAFLREDIADSKVIHNWCHSVNYNRIMPLLATKGDEIIADATLHMLEGGWMSHIGRVRIVVHPQYRKKGLATLLVSEIMKIAVQMGLEKLDGEFMGEQEGPIHVFEKLGFEKTAILPDHVRDIEGDNHDLVILIYSLQQAEYFAAD